MIVNYFNQHLIDTSTVDYKLNIISKEKTENASFFNNTFKSAIQYLFKPVKIDVNNMVETFPSNIGVAVSSPISSPTLLFSALV